MKENQSKIKKAVEPKRKCHDCGNPTNNYRCSKCLWKWRGKHGVSRYTEAEERPYDEEYNLML